MQLPGRHVVVTGAAGCAGSAPVHDAIVDELTLEASDLPRWSSNMHDLRRRVLVV